VEKVGILTVDCGFVCNLGMIYKSYAQAVGKMMKIRL